MLGLHLFDPRDDPLTPPWLCQARLEQLSPNWRRRLRIGRIKSLR
jgi:hypothetical protein